MERNNEITENAFNAERTRKESFNDSDPLRKPRSSSFKDSEKFVYRAGAFVREDSDAYSSGQCLLFETYLKVQVIGNRYGLSLMKAEKLSGFDNKNLKLGLLENLIF